MKILDKYIIKSFIAPFTISFLIAEFVLVMMFMWRYVDDFAGRGMQFTDFVQLLFYYSVTVIPMAIPITILIASVMVYGNISERYELSSMKSAGISLLRIMLPGFIIAFLTFLISVSVSNYFKPKSQYKFMELFTSIKRTKPTLNIKEKIFNKDFQGYAIQVNKKHKDGKHIEDIKIYDLSNYNNEKYNIITAKDGELFTTRDGKYFVMKLHDVYQYVEKIKHNKKSNTNTYPLMRLHFDTLQKAFDLAEFNKTGSSHFFSKRRDLMNSLQLMTEIDTFTNRLKREKASLKPSFYNILNYDTTAHSNAGIDARLKNINKKRLYSNTYKQVDNPPAIAKEVFAYNFEEPRIYDLLQSTNEEIEYEKSRMENKVRTIKRFEKYRNYWIMGLHKIYSLAVVCIIFLFIGAPLGSIIRKGGFGYPIIIAILFFTIFILLSISGDKFNKSGMFNPVFNAWLPVLVLLPVSIIITYKALRDSKILDIQDWTRKMLFLKKKEAGNE